MNIGKNVFFADKNGAAPAKNTLPRISETKEEQKEMPKDNDKSMSKFEEGDCSFFDDAFSTNKSQVLDRSIQVMNRLASIDTGKLDSKKLDK